MTYDASLTHLADRIRAGDDHALVSLLALASAQGDQITRLLTQAASVRELVEASFARRHNAQVTEIAHQAKEIARLRKQLAATGQKRGAA